MAESSQAAETLFENIRINYSRKSPEKQDQETLQARKQAWNSGCKNLGKALTAGHGPWVYGVFENFSCAMNGKGGTKSDSRAFFRLDILDTKSGVRFTVKQGGKSKKAGQVLGVFKLSATEHFPQYLCDPEFVDILALAISEYLPAAGRLGTPDADKSALASNPIRFSAIGSAKYVHPDAPKRIIFYRLRQDKRAKLWRSEVLGEAERADDGSFALPDSVTSAAKSGQVYIHRSEGPYNADSRFRAAFKDGSKKLDEALRRDELDELLNGKSRSLVDTLLGSAAAGYVGFRYGKQILPASSELGKLISKTSLISVFVEVRAGPVKGLRYYYDTVPEEKNDVAMADGTMDSQHLGFSRHVIGYSFGLELGSFIDRITIDPKVGVWRFDARLAASVDENGAVNAIESFQLGNTASLALETGIEADAEWYVLRGWAGMDTGYSLLKTGGIVSSYRFGIDAFLSLGPEIPFFFDTELKTTWILFYAFDRIKVKLKEEPEVELGRKAITGIAYDAAYAGIGVALSW